MQSWTAGFRRRGSVSAAIMLVGLSLTAAASQQERAAMPPIEEIAENLYLLAASDSADRASWTGGNTAVFVTEAGVVLVDTKLPGYGQDFIGRVREVTDKPITMVINTHTHFDHSGSNNELPDTITVVAHENTRANMARAECNPVTNCEAFQGEKREVPAQADVHGAHVALQRPGADRPVPLRARAHQRRHVRRLPRGAHDAHRRHVPDHEHAVHRLRQQRRQRLRVRPDALEGGRRASAASTRSSPAIPTRCCRGKTSRPSPAS